MDPVWARPPNGLRIQRAAVRAVWGVLVGWAALAGGGARAQIDPEPRRLFQAGYNQSVGAYGPIAAYGYLYWNQPHFLETNLTLRLAAAPVYLDAELGIAQALSPWTDLGVGLAGGGFADSYAEMRQGDYLTEESFTGHGIEPGVALYHRFNPHDRVPLNGLLRIAAHFPFYARDDSTAPEFEMPESGPAIHFRGGLRLGGREPYLTPKLAGEVSLWYEARYRLNDGLYGLGDDREVERLSQLFWMRALLAYTVNDTHQYFELTLNAGSSVEADRFSAYRLGGSLPMAAEFPLTIPGYFHQELSAAQFVLFTAGYLQPLDRAHHLSAGLMGSAGWVDYLPGLEQPGRFHSGVGAGLFWRSPSRAWQLGAAYGYGIEALRDGEEGAHSLAFLVQYDLDAVERAGDAPFWRPLLNANPWRGMLRLLGGR